MSYAHSNESAQADSTSRATSTLVSTPPPPPHYNYKMRREAFKFWDLLCLILETLRYICHQFSTTSCQLLLSSQYRFCHQGHWIMLKIAWSCVPIIGEALEKATCPLWSPNCLQQRTALISCIYWKCELICLPWFPGVETPIWDQSEPTIS